MPDNKIYVALLGFGKLGQGFYKAWQEKCVHIREKTGMEVIVKKILVKNISFKRQVTVDNGVLTDKIDDILNDKQISIAIDAIGGIEPIFSIIKKLIEHKINIISANRVLLATKMHQLADLAVSNKIYFLTEPSLGGGIPVSTIIQQDLVANKITQMFGIVSGASNYILDEMTDKGLKFEEVLKAPEIMTMSESISIIDYEGSDAAMKVSILAATAFGVDINYLHVYAEGIADITLQDVLWAKNFGYRIKHLAIMKDNGDSFEIRIHPTLVKNSHPLAHVRGKYNAVYIKTDLVGEYMVHGLGVGTKPTSSIIIRDLIDLASKISTSPDYENTPLLWNTKKILDIAEIKTSCYLRFPCIDRPGVMGEITSIIGKHNINIVSAHAEVDNLQKGKVGNVHIFAEDALEEEIRSALEEIKAFSVQGESIKFIRILDNGD